MNRLICTILFSACSPGSLPVSPDDEVGSRAASEAEVIFYDRLNQTYLRLYDEIIPGYLDHFRDEPDRLAAVYYFAGRLNEFVDDRRQAAQHYLAGSKLGSPATSLWTFVCIDRLVGDGGRSFELDGHERTRLESLRKKTDALAFSCFPQAQIASALEAVQRSNPQELEKALEQIGSRPRVVLSRLNNPTASPVVAECPMYDPELIWFHQRLAELRAGRKAVAEPAKLPDALAEAHNRVRQLRELPENRELSLRKFLDQNRTAVWRLGWLYRCHGLDLERAGDRSAAQQDYLRAWAIGDALFPAAMRGRLDRFDPVFLAELGDVYTRLGRYDLMLRYMYSDAGLPARYEIARPIVELARVAEAVRLVHSDETPPEQAEELLPETVSQILFEQPVPKQQTGTEPTLASTRPRGGMWGWVVLGSGFLLLLVGIAWRMSLAGRRAAEFRRV